MRKKIAILGSTGSIGRNLLEIVNKDKNKFEVTLLTANKNHTDLLKQAKRFKVKNIIVTNNESFEFLKKKKKKEIKIKNSKICLNKI